MPTYSKLATTSKPWGRVRGERGCSVVVESASAAECAVREVKEETGLDVEVTGIVGTYSDPKHVFAYDDGEVR